MKKTLTIMLASFAVSAAAMLAAPARAEAEPVSYSVVTADLDLRTAAGQRALDQRLANAARDVCGTASDVDVKGKNEVRACRDETLAKARAQRETVVAAAERGELIAVTASR